jgi:hypothetical protein
MRKRKGLPLTEVGRLGGIARGRRLAKSEREESARSAGKASAESLTQEERRERAKRAAEARWKKNRK